MKLGRRVRVYLIGVGLGLIASFIIFNNRGCEWMPGNRVMMLIEESLIQVSDFKACQMECYGITKNDVFNLIQNGEVSFSESQTSGDVKDYIVSDDEHKMTFQINMIDSVASITRFHGFEQECGCAGRSETAFEVLYKPNDMVLQQLVENGFEVTRRNECQFECFDIDSTYARSVLDDGLVRNELSFPHAKPNPTYLIQKIRNVSDTLLFKVEKGSSTRIIDIRWKNVDIPCDCD